MKRWLELDQNISERWRLAEQPHWRRRVAILLAHSGDSYFWLIAALLGLWRGDEFCRRAAWLALCGILITALIVQGLKFFIRRPRPQSEWGGVYRRLDPHSFPSGHAARAMMLAAGAAALAPSGWAVALGLWALGVSLARVGLGVHYLSDVIVGALIGLAVGVAAVAWIG